MTMLAMMAILVMMVMTTIMMTDGEDDDDEDYDDDDDDDDVDDGDDADDNDNDDGDMLLFLQLLRADPKSKKSDRASALSRKETREKCNAWYKVMASGRQVKCNVPKTSWLVAVRCQSRAASPLATAFVKRNCSAVRGLKPTAPLFVIRRDLLLACRCTQRDCTVGAKHTNPLLK